MLKNMFFACFVLKRHYLCIKITQKPRTRGTQNLHNDPRRGALRIKGGLYKFDLLDFGFIFEIKVLGIDGVMRASQLNELTA